MIFGGVTVVRLDLLFVGLVTAPGVAFGVKRLVVAEGGSMVQCDLPPSAGTAVGEVAPPRGMGVWGYG